MRTRITVGFAGIILVTLLLAGSAFVLILREYQVRWEMHRVAVLTIPLSGQVRSLEQRGTSRADDPFFRGFGQSTYTAAYPGTIKAFHWHRRQDDLWFVVAGMAQVVLHDLREDSPTRGQTDVYYVGDHNRQLVVIPKGVAHGYRVLGNQPTLLVYYTTEAYDPANPDEERIPFDDPGIGFDWSTKMK